jgi:HEAT repeat protein
MKLRRSYVAKEPRLNNSSMDLRRTAIVALGQLKAKDAIEALSGLANDPDSYGPHEAVAALGKIGGDSAPAAVEGVFRKSPDISLRQYAWRVLHKKGMER